MKKTITLLFASLIVYCSKAQVSQLDFENLVLPADSFYVDTNGTDFIVDNLQFQYDWDAGFNYWSGGFTYTNMRDSLTPGYSNLYSSRSGNGYYYSPNYLTGQNFSRIKMLLGGSNTMVQEVSVNNSAYAYFSMQDGDMFAKKFGGPTGNDPDWFKLTIRKYLGGILTNDSVEFYLADFRFANNAQDYIVKNWQTIDISSLGNADSLEFQLSSSDVGSFGMNTPAFFCLDHVIVKYVIGINESTHGYKNIVYPNPAISKINFQTEQNVDYSITGMNGKQFIQGKSVKGINTLDINELESGMYMLHIQNGNEKMAYKFLKQ